MTVQIFVPCDSAALAVGADDVAAAILTQAQSAGIDIELVRNGSNRMDKPFHPFPHDLDRELGGVDDQRFVCV